MEAAVKVNKPFPRSSSLVAGRAAARGTRDVRAQLVVLLRACAYHERGVRNPAFRVTTRRAGTSTRATVEVTSTFVLRYRLSSKDPGYGRGVPYWAFYFSG